MINATFDRQTSAFYTSGACWTTASSTRGHAPGARLRACPLPPVDGCPAAARFRRGPPLDRRHRCSSRRNTRTEAHRRALRRERDQPARRRVEAAGHLPAHELFKKLGDLGCSAHPARRVRRRRPRLQLLGGDGRGARQHALRRRADGDRRTDDMATPASPLRLRRAAQGILAPAIAATWWRASGLGARRRFRRRGLRTTRARTAATT